MRLMTAPQSYFATAARGLEPLLTRELESLGATALAERNGGVDFQADLPKLYRVLLGTRLASRLLLPLKRVEALSSDALYEAALTLPWPEIFPADARFAIDVAGHSPAITHTHFAALRLKDAVVDVFRERTGGRPDIDTDAPDIRLHLHLRRDAAQISLDISNGSLHRRGYRTQSREAPLKETLAAALLMRAGWPKHAAAGEAFIDPFCGSGTLVIEAAMMATSTAPGLLRGRFASPRWRAHEPELWAEVLEDVRAACKPWQGPPLIGSDSDAAAIPVAEANAARAGMSQWLRFEHADALTRSAPAASGLMVTNPPYGERLGSEADLIKLYSLFGPRLREAWGGWNVALLTGREDLGPRLGLRAHSRHAFFNGAIPCALLQFDINRRQTDSASPPIQDLAPDFVNRLRKNLRHLGKWARRNGVSCYRIYDADLPDYAVAVDQYLTTDGQTHLHVQEYAAPDSIEPARAEARLRGALAGLVSVTGVPAEALHFKVRRAQKGETQYTRQAETGRFFEVEEHGCRLRVNLDDYLDSGLFLDHRPMRLRLQREAVGKRFLNLFCYTGTASVHAARGGAAQTVSVDLSNTYLEWASENFAANGIHARVLQSYSTERPKHALVRADCLDWMVKAADQPERYELIFCDPPTFSNSKKMDEVFDIQRDHASLLLAAAKLLAPQGVLYFSTNRRRFKLDTEAMPGLLAEDITAQTLDEDFRRPRPAHRCWRITSTLPQSAPARRLNAWGR
jgi:23S rRNA (guanine2445-N2)-methyltransferase / 23S rRNA (guanine2069-N7)-methyltransferase